MLARIAVETPQDGCEAIKPDEELERKAGGDCLGVLDAAAPIILTSQSETV